MQLRAVVNANDVVRRMGYHFAMAGKVVLPDPLHLHVHVQKESLQDRIMLAVAFSTPAVTRAVLLHRPLMPGTGVLRAPARNLVASAGPALPSDTASCHQLLCVRRTVMSMTHAFFYLFTSSGSCRVFDSSCPDVLMLRCQRLAGTALALLLRVKLSDPAPDGTFAKRHSLCGLRRRFFKIFRCSLGDS